jgi:hypothetical protein
LSVLILKTIYNRPYPKTKYLSPTAHRLKVNYFFKIRALSQKARSLVLSAHHLLFILILLFLTCVLSIAPTATANAASVTLAWDKKANAIGYIMYYGTISKNYRYKVDVKNNTSCTISGLNNDITYYFAVTAYDSENNESSFSKEVPHSISSSYSTNASGDGPCDVFVPGSDWCQECGPCSEGQGDCDGDAECQSGLICAQNVGAKYGWPAGRDVCEQPSGGGTYNLFVPGPDWCRDYGPCSEGQGDCDGDAECQSGLICAQNVGAKYGWPAGRDVCEQPSGGGTYNLFVPGPDWCRDYGPCSEGQGDCDGDAECQSGLICAQNVGANYGWPAGRDVCESP